MSTRTNHEGRTMSQPLVAVTADVRTFDRYVWHATPVTYLKAALDGAGVLPLIVPNFGDRIDFGSLLDSVSGVLVTGSKTNVHPQAYGDEPDERCEPYDSERDATAIPLIRAAIDRGIPLLAICRGIQELNVALGGTLVAEVHEREGAHDHRAPESDHNDERFVIRQRVIVEKGTCLAAITGAGPLAVNSLHRQAIDRLAPGLTAEALAEDGTVEAVSVSGARAFALGVQWHPEYWAHKDAPSAAIFRAFGDAVRDYDRARRMAIAAE